MSQGGGVLDVRMAQDEMVSADILRRTMAQMLAMVGAAVPAASLSAESLGPDNRANGASVVYRAKRLSVSPSQLREEYLTRYWRVDPFHASRVADTGQTVVGTFQRVGLTQPANPFLEYAQEVDVPHFVRVFLRIDHRLAAYVFLGRTSVQRPFSERELTFLYRAVPFLESVYASALRPAPAFEGELLLSQAGLTRREADVARRASTGMRTREIAEELVLTEATVKTHLARVYRKLEVRGRAELAARLGPAAL